MKNLTPKQRQAIPLLACGSTGKEVAGKIKVNPATVSQWINHDPHFKTALDSFAEGSLRLAQIQIESLATIAVKELRTLILEADSDKVRLKAIELVLSAVTYNMAHIKSGKAGPLGVERLSTTNASRYNFDLLIESLASEQS